MAVRAILRNPTGLATMLAALAAPVAASAQAYQCTLPEGRIAIPETRQDGPTRDVTVMGYTLALSWSPEFCRFRKGEAQHARQCAGRAGRFGFIVHGLWPEGRGANWPQYCPANRRPSQTAVRRTLCAMPGAALIARQWRKHGACIVPEPDAYLKVTRILWNSLQWPDFDRLSRREALTAGVVRETFATANPFWEPGMIGLKLNERGWLQEMRLCYGLDFMPARCNGRRFGPSDHTAVKIWRGL